MSGLRSLVSGVLADADLLLAAEKQQRLRREAVAAGKRFLAPRFLGSSLLADPVLQRIFGFGWQQAGGLAALAHTPTAARSRVAQLGGLFNLGIALFDHLCDNFPERAELLLARVTPESLAARLSGRPATATPTDDPAVDQLLTLIAEFFTGVAGLGGADRDRRTFARLVRTMYSGERIATRARRDDGPPTSEVWRALRGKSARPMETMALLALLARSNDDPARRSTVRRASALAGEALWIVDDLADVREDWDAGCWSRPLWLLSRESGNAPDNADDAIRRLLDASVATAEARRLAERLGRLRGLSGAPERAFFRPVQAAVQSWLELLPD